MTGRAPYAYEHKIPNALCVMVMSTIAKGRIASIDTRAAERSRGVLLVMTHQNAPKLPQSEAARSANAWTAGQDRSGAARRCGSLRESADRRGGGGDAWKAREGAHLVQVHYAVGAASRAIWRAGRSRPIRPRKPAATASRR